MEKILLAMNSRDIDLNAIRFACHLTRVTHSKITGIFLENVVSEEEIVISVSEDADLYTESITVRETTEINDELTMNNIRRFGEIAEQEGVEGFIEVDDGIPAEDILGKTRFADLLIVDAKTSFSGIYENPPTRFVKDILQEAECPVVIAPESFSGIDSIAFCYNSTKASVFAIKQFICLFPEYRDKKAKVIYLERRNEDSRDEELALKDWLKYHFSEVEIVPVEGNARDCFFNYLSGGRKDFVVMGPYGRGLLDSFFENDPLHPGIKSTRLPVFVSHY